MLVAAGVQNRAARMQEVAPFVEPAAFMLQPPMAQDAAAEAAHKTQVEAFAISVEQPAAMLRNAPATLVRLPCRIRIPADSDRGLRMSPLMEIPATLQETYEPSLEADLPQRIFQALEETILTSVLPESLPTMACRASGIDRTTAIR